MESKNLKKSIDKRISLIDRDVFLWLEEEKKKDAIGICEKKFHADYIVENLYKYSVGDELTFNNIRYIIEQIGKTCYKEECDLFKIEKKPCRLIKGVAFAKEK
ncbi:MAG: hypothetical protein Q4F88_01495 [Eubacteriales bacterium]|nr:hypothetical protein [Eubacteriales bacterium]